MRPTFENCGIYINRTIAEYSKKLSLKLYYREAGTKDFLPAFDPVEVWQENAWRGSLLMLRENTRYEVKAVISGELEDTVTGEFTTLNSEVKIARTVVLDPAEFKGSLTITESGTPDGYIRYTMKGGVLKGKKARQAVISAKNVKYLVFENLTIDGNFTPGGLQLLDAQNIIVRNCEIYGFGRVAERRMDVGGTFCDPKTGKRIYYDPGIEITNCRDVLVERCYIHNPTAFSNTWFYSHPAGPTAIRVLNNEGVVLRYNDLVGGDLNRYIDVVHGPGNGTYAGGFKRDADIYGNLMIFSDDDGIELEGGEMNLRAYLNRFEGTYSGTSTGAAQLGPCYVFRNLYVRPGDEDDCSGSALKSGLQRQGYGAVYYLNNTVTWQSSPYGITSFHKEKPEANINPLLKCFTRNNIIACGSRLFHRTFYFWRSDVDYDLIHIRKPNPSTVVDRQALDEGGQEKHAIYAEPQYVAPERGDFRLRPRSPGWESAQNLPDLKVVHRGAFQEDGIAWLPYRPLPVDADWQEIYFKSSQGEMTRKFTVTTGGKGIELPFKTNRSEDFFTVTPESGVFRSGGKIEFTVTVHPEKLLRPRVYSGAILLRTDAGLSMPITVYADFGDSAERRQEMLKHAIVVPAKLTPESPTMTTTVNIPEDGTWFLLADISECPESGNFQVKLGDMEHSSALNRGASMRAMVPFGGLSATYFPLKAGEHRLSIQADGELRGQIVRWLITKEPHLFTWRQGGAK